MGMAADMQRCNARREKRALRTPGGQRRPEGGGGTGCAGWSSFKL